MISVYIVGVQMWCCVGEMSTGTGCDAKVKQRRSSSLTHDPPIHRCTWLGTWDSLGNASSSEDNRPRQRSEIQYYAEYSDSSDSSDEDE